MAFEINEELEKRFTYHSPTEKQQAIYPKIRGKAKELAYFIENYVPNGREKSLALTKLEEGLSPIILTNIIEIKLLDYLGVSPNIDSCSICGSNKNIVTLSSSAGGYVCSSCYTNEYIVSEKTIKIVRMYYYVDIKNIKKLEVSPLVTKEINIFLNDYYDRYTGLYIKSKDFIKKVNQITKI